MGRGTAIVLLVMILFVFLLICGFCDTFLGWKIQVLGPPSSFLHKPTWVTLSPFYGFLERPTDVVNEYSNSQVYTEKELRIKLVFKSHEEKN